MPPATERRLLFIYTLLVALCGIGYARYSNYQLDGDAVAFMDIADRMQAHDLAHVVNGYWNPAYAAALALGQIIAHPGPRDELQVFFWVDFVIFVACIAACILFVRALAAARTRLAPAADGPPALSGNLLLLASLALLFTSFQRELLLSAVRSDALLLFFFLLAGSLVLRLQSGGRFLHYPLLGLTLGLAYLTKSFAFLPSGLLLAGIFLFGITRKPPARRRIVSGAVLAGIVFAAVAGPYIVAISKQRGRPTTGESARLNYAFFIDHTARWHEAHSGELGHATADFKHPEEVLLEHPAVFSYMAHPFGTYPLWFDPAYWTDTIQPKFYLAGHLQRLARCTALLLRFLLGHLEAFVLVGVFLLTGCFFERHPRASLPLLVMPLWGILMFAIYFPIDLQDRYLTGGLLLIAIPILAMLRRPAQGDASAVATGVVLLFAGLTLANAFSDLAARRRAINVSGFSRGAYDPEIYTAADALPSLGILPGQPVACFGDRACYVDHYWARLARTPIRAEIEVPNFGDPGAFWKTLTNPQEVAETLRSQHIAAIVGFFAPSQSVPAGWQKLGRSDFYAYPLNAPAAR